MRYPIPFLPLSIIVGILFTQLCTGSEQKENLPNILFILVDDQRNDTLSCAGHPQIKTPIIDGIAAGGVRFENAFVNMPICMASRATIFSGLTYTGHGHTGGSAPAILLQSSDVDTSVPVRLRQHGYRNGFYGKQHVRFAENNRVALKRMFDDHKIYGGGPHFVKQDDGSKRHSAEVIGDHSVKFLQEQPKDRPFFLYMSFNIAHAVDHNRMPGIGHFPWPKAVDGMYEDIEPIKPRLLDPKYFEMQPDFLKDSLNRVRWYWRWDTEDKYRINMRAYYRMLSGMDRVIGRVTEQLKKQGLLDNTIIIYTGDNGFYMGERGFAGKWSHYEESLRVPLIINDLRPGREKLSGGSVLDQLVSNVDLPATILDFAEVEIPEKYQGKSLVELVEGKVPSNWRNEVFTEFESSHKKLPRWQGIRSARYTYARYDKQTPVAEFMYDLERDPDQLRNLVGVSQHQKVLEEMRSKTDNYIRSYTREEISKIQKNRRK